MTPLAPPPMLAIVTVVLNDLPGLLATRASLRRQTDRRFQWIVVDGGSRDGAAAWLAAHDREMHWWRSAPDHGLYDAMNRGLDRATADAVLFLNAGDTLAEPTTLAAVNRALAASDAGLIYGDALERGPRTDGGGPRPLWLKRARSHRLAALGMFTHHQSIIYRLSAIGDRRYDPAYPIGADYDFTLAALRRGVRVDRFPAPIAVFRAAGASRRGAAQGRADQARIRRRHYPIATLWNAPLSSLQWMTSIARTLFPSTYATLRFREYKR